MAGVDLDHHLDARVELAAQVGGAGNGLDPDRETAPAR